MSEYTGDLISKDAAIQSGLTRFFPGTACKYGHVSQRLLTGRCYECHKLAARNAAKRKYEKEGGSSYYKENRVLVLQNALKMREERRADTDGHAVRLEQQRHYNNTRRLKRLNTVAGRQRPKECDICGTGSKRIAFDHCHATGKFRGWLCINCNTALGMAQDDPAILRKLAIYLENVKLSSLNQ